MTYISEEQAVKFALAAMTYDDREDTCVTIRARELANAMNTAIAHFIGQAEGLPEPYLYDERGEGIGYTREQMIQYAAQYKLDAERYRWLKTQQVGEWEAAAMAHDTDAAIDHWRENTNE